MPTILSFRADDDFAEETDKAAELLGRTRSEHLRIAIDNENRRALEARMAFLSQKLADSSLIRELDTAAGDGLEPTR